MGDKSAIEWTDATWNVLRGCSRVSEGCRHCYAEREAWRHGARPGQPYYGLVQRANGHAQWTGEVRFVEEALGLPLKWKEPRRIFVNSMSDLFHEKISFPQICVIIQVMLDAPQHTYQILTKRPERMLEFFRSYEHKGAFRGRGELKMLPANTWWGVSCENQHTADTRVPFLLQTPMLQTRWVSAEPLLGPIDLRPSWLPCYTGQLRSWGVVPETISARLDWLVVGGESGPGARPMHPDWVRILRDQCVAAGVPFFFKQWGEWAPIETNPKRSGELAVLLGDGTLLTKRAMLDHPEDKTGELIHRIGKKAAGRELDGRTWEEYPATLGELEVRS